MGNSGPHLFFQIAAALIPALLFAGSRGLPPERVFALTGKTAERFVVVGAIVILAAAAVVAEFFAIAGALSSSIEPSAFRVTFVAVVIGIATTFVAVAFATPWIEAMRPPLVAEPSLWASPPSKSRPILVTNVVGALFVLGALGSFLLSASVYESLETRSRAQEYCLKKGFVDNMELVFVAEERSRRVAQKLIANFTNETKIVANRALSPKAKAAELRDVRSERRVLISDREAADDQIKRILELSAPRDTRTIDDYLVGVGCP